MEPFVEQILRSGDPANRLKLTLAGIGPGDPRALREEVAGSARVADLLAERGPDGRIDQHPYTKWTGAHWVLATLADLGYPPGDDSLLPLREQVFEWLLDDRRFQGRRPPGETYFGPIRSIAGRPRLHASMEGNALYALLALGIADERVDSLARVLVASQWEDGGWNCDQKRSASHSSFEETLLPLRGLIWHSRERGDPVSAKAAQRTAELFLERGLFRRLTGGAVISPDFVQLHYPCYWHYDVLFALKVLDEGGWLGDPRCAEAIALVRSKQLPDGGFPAEAKFWYGRTTKSGRTLVSWGPVGPTRSNEFVTADALTVLRAPRRKAEG